MVGSAATICVESHSVNVSLVWNGTPMGVLPYRGVPGGDVLRVAEFVVYLDHSEGILQERTAV